MRDLLFVACLGLLSACGLEVASSTAPLATRTCEPRTELFPVQFRFSSSSAVLDPQDDEIVRDVIERLRGAPVLLLVVNGHRDICDGEDELDDLDERRAEAVRQALLENGIPPERVYARGFDATQPRGPFVCEYPPGYWLCVQENRRVELEVVRCGTPGDRGARFDPGEQSVPLPREPWWVGEPDVAGPVDGSVDAVDGGMAD